MNTTIPDRTEGPPLTSLAFLAELWGVQVTVADDIPATQCEWCGLVDAVTRARVIGDPPQDSTVWAAKDCCRDCMESVVKAAHAAQRDGSRHPIRLELAA
jgi:hypothetical protein